MDFGSVLFLIGTVAAAIPLVLHLIHNTRAPKNPFPTVRFLRRAAEKTARRRHVQNLFLLLLRMAMFALLAVALARPFLSRDLELLSSQASTQAAVILDNSMSQSATFGGATRLQRTKAEAEALMKSSLRPAEAMLLLADGPLARQPAELLRDRDVVIQRIRQTEVGYNVADMASLLRAAYARFDAKPAAAERIYIFTDLQKQSWMHTAELKELADHPRIPVCVVYVDDPDFSNVAVTGLHVAGLDRVVGFPVPLEVTLWSSPDLKGERSLCLYVDDMTRPRERLVVTMPIVRGQNDRVTFHPTFDAPGRHRLRVEIEAEDSLPLDNARLDVVDIKGDIGVLLVRDARGLAGVDDPVFYLERALSTPPAVEDKAWAVKPKVVAPSEVTPEALAADDVVVLADVAALSDEAWSALAAFVQSGKTLIVFPGEFTNVARFNDHAGAAGPAAEEKAPRPLMPATLAAVEGDAATERTHSRVLETAVGSDLLINMADLKFYQQIVVRRYHRLQLNPAAGTEVLLRLEGGDPLLVASHFGRGRVYLFAVPAAGEWSNLQRTNIFLPLVLRMAHRAAQRHDWPTQIISGQVVTLDYAAETMERLGVLLADPEHGAAPKRLETIVGPALNTVHISETFPLGFYTATPQSPTRADLAWAFAVNPDGRESDLTPLTVDELRQRMPAREVYVAASVAELEKQLKSFGRQELWQYFLVTVLLLTIFECLVSNRLRPKGGTPGIKTLIDRLRGRAAV
jgi:hypothetical protein